VVLATGDDSVIVAAPRRPAGFHRSRNESKVKPVIALSNRSFQHVTDWVGGASVVIVIGLLLMLDTKVLTSKRAVLQVIIGAAVVAAAASVVVASRFVKLSA
jgi:hypothetical protein